MEFLTNPWVITIIVLAVIIGNIMVLKNTANMKFDKPTRSSQDLDRLNELDKQRHEDEEEEQKK
ncbi:DUF2897 family protein [Vibrio tapetis]|uniref:DUF2897 domain-containing protein n=1 Tax=Vibrio tapetis subsp. tapetis TaxID=1671868 RepID=A0A2N8ZEC6_9VIBR|nr:DUF2897 family protein [Vibrio tapetis]SON50262.1 conserved protein of unknown function [Vibrio tapetis subsp. tapetis]